MQIISFFNFLLKDDASEDKRLHPEDCKDRDSGYYGVVESLSCDLAEPKSDSEDDLSEVFSEGNTKNVLRLSTWQLDSVFPYVFSVIDHK